MVSAGMAPLEQGLKAMLVDMVRRCQSTVAQNYGRINSPRGGEGARTECPFFDSLQTLPPTSQSTSDIHSEPPLLPTIQSTSNQLNSRLSSHKTSTTFGGGGPDTDGMIDFFGEPPLLNTDLVDNSLEIGFSAPQKSHSDSGYGSFLFFCECPDRLNDCAGKLHMSQYMQEHHLTSSRK